MGTYMGVDTDDSDIVNAIRNMDNRGASKEQIIKVVGMPMEVVDRHVARNREEKRHSKPKSDRAKAITEPLPVDDAKKQAARERMAHARAARKAKDSSTS